MSVPRWPAAPRMSPLMPRASRSLALAHIESCKMDLKIHRAKEAISGAIWHRLNPAAPPARTQAQRTHYFFGVCSNDLLAKHQPADGPAT